MNQTQARTCAGCDKPARNQRVICARCENEVRRKLGQQIGLRDDLTTEYTKQARKVEQLRVHGFGEARIPYEESASRVLDLQWNFLRVWLATCANMFGVKPPRCSLAFAAHYLALALPQIVNRAEAAQLLAELRQLHRDILAIIDLPAILIRGLGPCIEKYPNEANGGADEYCPGQVEALVNPGDDLEPGEMRCNKCDVGYHSMSWARVGKRILARAAELAKQRQLAASIAKEMTSA